MSFVLSLDAGTTSIRALIINDQGKILAVEQIPLTQIYKKEGWIEHSPIEIWENQQKVIAGVLKKSGIDSKQIASIGITNQRETTIIWEKKPGKPIANAIVWSDKRTKDQLFSMNQETKELVHKKTGLFLESYFSASKIKWLLDNIPLAREKALNGELCFGTVNTWILWNLTQGEVFATDVSNASRTLLFNIHTLSWDSDLLSIFDIPLSILPVVRSCSETYGYTTEKTPIGSMIGDQQAALFGNACFKPGDLSCTFGTGAFALMLTGKTAPLSKNRLLETIAWKIGDQPVEYALEGLVYAAGSVINWLRDSIGLIEVDQEIEGLAYSVPDSGGVTFVPALNGLASPYWNADVKGAFLGLTSGTNIGHIARAVIEGIACQVKDVIEAMILDASITTPVIKCGGRMSENLFFMQTEADLLGFPILKTENKETTALGAGFLAGLSVGYWKDKEEIYSLWKSNRKFEPEMGGNRLDILKKNWQYAIETAQFWAKRNSQVE
jgi:glycerol kinase